MKKRQRPSSHTRRIKTKKGRKKVKINRHIKKKKPKIKKRSMALFSEEEKKDISQLDLDTDELIGEGEHGEVFAIDDDFVLKKGTTRISGKYSNEELEQRKFEKYKENPLVIPSHITEQGLVRPKVRVITRGVTKKDWNDKNIEREGYLVVESKDITDEQTKEVIEGINQFSADEVSLGDEVQIGIDKKGKPLLFDLGEIYPSGDAREDNDDYKERFLKGIGKSHLFDRDRKKEQEEAEKELNNLK